MEHFQLVPSGVTPREYRCLVVDDSDTYWIVLVGALPMFEADVQYEALSAVKGAVEAVILSSRTVSEGFLLQVTKVERQTSPA